eukprot:Rmarinus@m.21136
MLRIVIPLRVGLLGKRFFGARWQGLSLSERKSFAKVTRTLAETDLQKTELFVDSLSPKSRQLLLQTLVNKYPHKEWSNIKASRGLTEHVFTQLDQNKDGAVSQAEYDNFMEGIPATGAPKTHPESKPSWRQLYLVSWQNGLPFIGFGFLDNFIMIIAGDYIDHSLGATLGISTMAAAGLGNMISDVFGLGMGNTIEALAIKLGARQPNLTKAQQTMTITKSFAIGGTVVGVCIGCMLGMVPLVFLDT